MTQCAALTRSVTSQFILDSQCTRAGKIEVDGKMYCTQHGKKRLADKASKEYYASKTWDKPATA